MILRFFVLFLYYYYIFENKVKFTRGRGHKIFIQNGVLYDDLIYILNTVTGVTYDDDSSMYNNSKSIMIIGRMMIILIMMIIIIGSIMIILIMINLREGALQVTHFEATVST